jgi:hypothetical protein
MVIVTCVEGGIDSPVNSEHSTSSPLGAPQLPTASPATLIVPPPQPENVVPLPNGIWIRLLAALASPPVADVVKVMT